MELYYSIASWLQRSGACLAFSICKHYTLLWCWIVVGLQFLRTVSILPLLSRQVNCRQTDSEIGPLRKEHWLFLKGLFKVLGGLTLGEIERVWNGKALQFHGFIITGGTTGCTEKGDVGVCVHAFMLQRCPEGFTLKWKTCQAHFPSFRCYCCSSSQYAMCNMSCDLKQEFNTLRLSFL